MKEIFDSYIENAFGAYEQAAFKFRQFEFNYKTFFPENKNAKVLDIGIGRGEMLTCMKNWGYTNYYGIDISPNTVEFCKSLNLNCEFVKDIEHWLDNHKQEFDLITLLDVLEHVPKKDTIRFLQKVKHSLKRNCLLIIQVPNLQAPDGQLHMFNDFTHEVGYIEHSLAQVLMCSGFKNFQFFGFEELVFGGFKEIIKKTIRSLYWSYIRLTRKVNCNLNPQILHPVFYAIVTNE